MSTNQRDVIRRQVLPHTLPGRNVAQMSEFWDIIQDTIRAAITTRRNTVRKDLDKHKQQQLKQALARIRGDFGRRKRTFKAALLRNPPMIPLWGVLSSHPDTVVFKSWTVEQVELAAQGCLHGVFEILDSPKGVCITCEQHDNVSRMVQQVATGECTVSNPRKEQLVADTDNMLAGIEQFFGVNVLGTHP